jgi:hypothetical protein
MYNNGNSSKNVTGTSVVDGTLESADFADNGLSGDKIDGGIISNFQSTGIDDRLSTEKAITIDASENVMISDATFIKYVDIRGSSAGQINISDASGDASDYRLKFYNSNGLVGHIKTSGSTTSFNTSSDYRLKENVAPMVSSIDRLKQLKPSRFNFISNTNTTVDGFLAHEAQAVVPEAVTGVKDGMKDIGVLSDSNNKVVEEDIIKPKVLKDGWVWVKTGEALDYQAIDQSKLVPLLVSALQEAITRIEQLENNK